MSTAKRLEAHTENRTFYFTVDKQTENEVSIIMYSTPYTLVRDGKLWRNHAMNKLTMAQHLINAVITAVNEH